MSDTKTVKLSKPFKSFEGTATHFIEMRTVVTVGDLRAANKAEQKGDPALFALIVRMSGRIDAEIEQLAVADYNKLCEALDFGAEKDASDPKD